MSSSFNSMKLSMKRKPKKRKQLFDLPEELLLEILILLPSKSIKTCKLVSKQWKNLIDDPSFATRYLRNGSMIVLLDSSQLYYGLLSHSNEKITRNNVPSYTFHRIQLSLNRSVLHHELLSGCSNGHMVCVKAERGFFHLYNLFTRDREFVVKSAPLHLHPESWIYYGFGYDRYDDDYKIVVVCDYNAGGLLKSKYKERGKKFDMSKFQDEENNYYYVYRHKLNRWNVFYGFPNGDYSWSTAKGQCYSLKGVLHSIVGVKGERAGFARRVIVTYDIHTRRFGEISLPDGVMACGNVKVTEFDGRLCCAYRLASANECLMEVRDVGGCWTKALRIDSSVPRDLWGLGCLDYAVLHERVNGGKYGLLVCEGTLIWYDYSKNKIGRVDSHKAWLKQNQQEAKLRRKMGTC